MDFDAIADELYGLPLDDFIPVRARWEKQAKGANDRKLAAEIHRLAKPNAVAWLVNQLVRNQPKDIQTLVVLGSEMRKATANLAGDRLRDLSRQQHQVVRGLVERAEHLSNAAGRRLSADGARSLEMTFHAALADQGASDALSAGRLSTNLRFSGFDSLVRDDIQLPKATKKSEHRTKDGSPARRGAGQPTGADTEVAQARSTVAEATESREVLRGRMRQAEQDLSDATDRVEQLRGELHQAIEMHTKAKSDHHHAQEELDRADRRVLDAQRRAEALEKRLGP